MKKNQHKPDKPYPDFPLFPHDNGQWAKKIRKKLHYFGVWSDWQAAIENYERSREALYAGRDPKTHGADGLSVADACNLFLEAKEKMRDSKEITPRTFEEYEDTCRLIIDTFGRNRTVLSLVAADFDSLRELLAKRYGPISLGNRVTRVRTVFRYLDPDHANLIDRAVTFGPDFRRPSKKLLRLAKAQAGPRLFANSEINTLIASANSRLKAMIYLGINCALGNSDIGHLEHSHLDLKGGWLNYPRVKTGINRRAKLWSETVKALKAVPSRRAAFTEHEGLVFLTQTGHPWAGDTRDSPVAKEMAKLLKACDMKRKGLSFYSLRHTFLTIGEESKDMPAVYSIMGHAPRSGDMSSIYRHGVSDDRLEHVSEYVRAWLKGRKKVSAKVS